jgi:hypothetical protein
LRHAEPGREVGDGGEPGGRYAAVPLDGAISPFAPKDNFMTPQSAAPKKDPGGLPVTEKKEQRAQEMDWENEGGSVKKDEKP